MINEQTFGTKTRHNVSVVQNMTQADVIMTDTSLGCALVKVITGTPIVHIVNTLYTANPTKNEIKENNFMVWEFFTEVIMKVTS